MIKSMADLDNTFNSCRICLDTNCEEVVLLEEDSDWLRLYSYCSGLSLTLQDKPRAICNDCAGLLQKFALFKDKCIESDEVWRKKNHTYQIIDDSEDEAKPEYVSDISYKLYDSKTIHDNLEIEDNDSSDSIKIENNNDSDVKEENISLRKKANDNFETEDDHGSDSIKPENYSDIDTSIIENSDTELKDEISSSTKKKKFKCGKCQKNYELRKCYLKHIKVCRGDVCPEKIYKNRPHLPKTTLNEQNDKSQLPCGLCKNSFNGQTDLIKHLDEHWTSGDLQCKLCEFVAGDLAVLAVHRYSHQISIDVRFKCHICEKWLTNLNLLEFHYRSIHLNKKGGFCFLCDIEFSYYRAWKKHSAKHGSDPFICDLCGKTYYSKYQIIDHFREHIKKFVCEHCGMSFARFRNMKEHMEAVHTTEKPVKCSHCDKMFKTKLRLQKHLFIATREKCIKCEVCLKMFASNKSLNLHMISHSDLKPHVCDICGNRYKYKSHYVFHKKSHGGIFSYKCTFCDRTFPNKWRLRIHTAVHTGVRQFKCEQCTRSFHSKKLLEAHHAKYHVKD